MSSSLWLARDCFVAPVCTQSEHRVRSGNILSTVLQHYHLHAHGGKWWIFFSKDGMEPASLFP